MLSEKKMARLNELGRKCKTVELSIEEKDEQLKLREEYLEVFRATFKQQLERIEIVDVEEDNEKGIS